jgi:class 3 adenylate cyclase
MKIIHSARFMQRCECKTEMRRYGDRMRTHGQTSLQVRIGVNSGEVVVRGIQTGADHNEYTPIGHSTSLAARLVSSVLSHLGSPEGRIHFAGDLVPPFGGMSEALESGLRAAHKVNEALC